MIAWAIVAISFVLVAIVIAVVIQWFRAFYTMPIQASIRALLGLLALLAGSKAIPVIQGNVLVDLDWGFILRLKQAKLAISTGTPLQEQITAWVCVTILLAICFHQTPRADEDRTRRRALGSEVDEFLQRAGRTVKELGT